MPKAGYTKGCCPVCKVQKSVGLDGLMRPHQRHEKPCAGAGQLPHVRKERARTGWAAVRWDALVRDGHRCRKCHTTTGQLDAHHVNERSNGGRDELENLITLCGTCHVEWHQGGLEDVLTLNAWLAVPPARMLAVVWARPWPVSVSAYYFKEQVELAINLARQPR